MVFFFTSNVVSPGVVMYMGLDKNENEDLIRWGFPEDVWVRVSNSLDSDETSGYTVSHQDINCLQRFHVDKVSSAHVYLRLRPNETLDDVPQAVIDDCAQLVKANSIQGNKMNNVDVVYTMWDNLKKTAGMDVGQVGFHKNKEVRKVKVEKRINEIVNRLNKTKEEKFPDLRALREDRDRLEREDQKHKLQEQKRREKEELERKEKERESRSYSNLMSEDKMTSNRDAGEDSDDFM